MDGGAGGQTGAPVRSSITSNEKTKAGGEKRKKKGYLSKFILQPVRLREWPRHRIVRASKKRKREKKKNKAAEKRNRDDGGKKRTSC